MASPALYERTFALHKEQHKDLKIRIVDDHYAFANKMNAMPLAIGEFTEASHYFPIVFIEGEKDAFHPVVLLGLEQNSNLFVSPEGKWALDEYIPAFARRYPFILGTTEDKDTLAVHVDESYPGLNTEEGMAFFENGEESAYLKQLLDFIRAFQNEIHISRQFSDRLHELELLEARSITVTRDGADYNLTGFWVVNEEKYAALSDAIVLELYRNGALALIERHLSSLANIHRLGRRADRIRGEA